MPLPDRPSIWTGFWLMKGELSDSSIDHLAQAPQQTLGWTGVRNYQARNFMRDHMREGDGVLVYHASCAEPGIAGLARIRQRVTVDPTQFDPASPYFDPKSAPAQPRWIQIDVEFVRKTRFLSLKTLRQHPALATMTVLQKGNRLSITPVTAAEWQAVMGLLEG